MESVQAACAKILDSIHREVLVDRDTLIEMGNGISLLALKNDALLSYIANLLLLAAAQVEKNSDVFQATRSRTIEQRVTLEKGVKGLEAKISYQIDKALRAFRRSQEAQQKAQDDADSDSDVDLTSYRPNVANLRKASGANSEDEPEDDDKRRYVVPKISSTAPSFENTKKQTRRRDFAMEDYLRETGDAPVVEASIGSQIMDGGRGGERTERQRRKDREIEDYEEANFTRISNISSKRARKEAAQRQKKATTSHFFGEDWGFLDNKRRKK